MKYIDSSNVDIYSKFIKSGDLTPDNFLMFQDASANELTKMKRLQSLQEKTYTTDSEKTEMTQLLEDLREFMPTSEDWNKLCCGIYSVQVFLRDGIVMFLQQKKDEFNAIVNEFKHIGDYDPIYKYKKGNMVTFDGEGYTCKKDNVGVKPNPLQTTDYWTKYTIKGDKGEPSLNLFYRGEYDATRTYNLANGDACTIDGTLYYAKADNIVGLYPPHYADSWANFTNSAIYINTVLPTVGTRSKDTLYFLQTDSKDLEKGILQDYLGNVLKPQTHASNVIYGTSTVKDTLDNLTSAQIPYLKTTNVGNNYSITIPNLTTLPDGYNVRVKFNANSTGAITVNPNNMGSITVIDYYGNNITDVRNNLIVNLVYESSTNSFILLGKGGDGDALASNLLINKTATTKNGKIKGNMPDRGSLNVTLPINGTQDIPYGYYSGGTIRQSVPDRGSPNIQLPINGMYNLSSGYYSGGSIRQSIPIKSAQTYTPSTYNQTIAGGQYLNENQTILGDGNLLAKNILKGIKIFGITGTAPNYKYVTGTTTTRCISTSYRRDHYVDLDFVPDIFICARTGTTISHTDFAVYFSAKACPTSVPIGAYSTYHDNKEGHSEWSYNNFKWTPSASMLVFTYSYYKSGGIDNTGLPVNYIAIQL